jgi:tRNA (cmo5U34)-methyltransferase
MIARRSRRLSITTAIKKHFEEEAAEFDGIILKLIPYYGEMLEALVSAIPFEKHACFHAIDLGCGTGTIARKIKDHYPNSRITCLDLAENMVEMAKVKLQRYPDVAYIVGDFGRFEFDRKYDLAISSLALHHLSSDGDKRNFFKKIYASLNNHGTFLNADVVLASNDYLQKKCMDKWIQYMNKRVGQDETVNKWIPKYEEEDRPAKLVEQMKWLEDAGFREVDVIWKYYNFAVYGAYKR